MKFSLTFVEDVSIIRNTYAYNANLDIAYAKDIRARRRERPGVRNPNLFCLNSRSCIYRLRLQVEIELAKWRKTLPSVI